MSETKKNNRNNPEFNSIVDTLLKGWKDCIERDTLAAIVDGINIENYVRARVQSTHRDVYIGYVTQINSETMYILQDKRKKGGWLLDRKSISTITL